MCVFLQLMCVCTYTCSFARFVSVITPVKHARISLLIGLEMRKLQVQGVGRIGFLLQVTPLGEPNKMDNFMKRDERHLSGGKEEGGFRKHCKIRLL